MDGESETTASIVDGVRMRLMDDWRILQNVFKLVQREETICADPQQWQQQKIVDFMQPDELKVSAPVLPIRGLDVRLVKVAETVPDKRLLYSSLKEFTMQLLDHFNDLLF